MRRRTVALVLAAWAASGGSGALQAYQESDARTRSNGPKSEEYGVAYGPHVRTVAMNPVADTFLKRALQHIVKQEQLELSASAASALVQTADGDLRSMVHSLQFFCKGTQPSATAATGIAQSRPTVKADQ